MATLSIIDRLPDPSTLDSEFESLLNNFNNLIGKVQAFSPSKLDQLLQASGSLPIPNNLTLIEDVLENFSKMAGKIPADPQQLTYKLTEVLGQLKNDLSGISEIIMPITTVIDTVLPLLEKFDTLNNAVSRINTMLADLPGKYQGLNLANLPEQFEYFTRLFDLFPEVVTLSPFAELKAQINSLKIWLTSTSDELSEYFRNQTQTIADALPTQLNAIIQEGLDAITAIRTPLQSLERNIWFNPYNQALDEIELIDLNDLSKTSEYIALVEGKVSELSNISVTLNQNAQHTFDALNDFNINFFSQDLRHAFMNIIRIISPEEPGILALLFKKMKSMISSIEIHKIQKEVSKVGLQFDGLFGNIDLMNAITTIQEVSDRIIKGIDVVNQALVEVATTLSNSVNQIKTLIDDIDIPDLISGVENGLNEVSTAVNDILLPDVNEITLELDSLVQELRTGLTGMNTATLTDAIRSFLSQITAVLDDPQIHTLLEDAQKGIEEIAAKLDDITLNPIFEKVLNEIKDLQSKLATVDVSELNDFLKVALKTALDLIREIDFADDVAGVLTQEFQSILDQSVGLVRPLEDKYKEITGKIEQFNPGTMVAVKLTPLFEILSGELKKVEPGKIADPLKKIQDSLKLNLKPIEPGALLKPLIDVHGDLIQTMKSFSPHDLIAPLNKLLSEITSVINELKIEEMLSRITGTVEKANLLISNFSLGNQIRNTNFWTTLEHVEIQGQNFLGDIENKTDKFLDEMVNLIPALDMSVLQPALDALSVVISVIENHINSPAVLTQMTEISGLLNTQNWSGGVTELTQRWVTLKARLEGFTPPAEYAADYDALKQEIRKLSPIELLNAPATLVKQATAQVKTEVDELTAMKESLGYLLRENQSKFSALLPTEFTSSGFKKLLRDALEDQLGTPLKQVIQLIHKRFNEFAEVLRAVITIGMKLKTPFDALTIIPDNINAISNALISAKNNLTGINLNFLEDELQGVIDAVIAQLGDSFKSDDILNKLDTTFGNIITALDSLYPEAQIQVLKNIYKADILGKIEVLHPDKTIAEPLNTEYQNIVKLKDKLNVEKIFDVMNGKLDAMNDELEEGLQQTANAFNGLLAALPL